MECPILKSSILRSMPSVAVALMEMGAIPMSDAERATGQVSEERWRNNERTGDAGASESGGREHSGLL